MAVAVVEVREMIAELAREMHVQCNSRKRNEENKLD